MVLKRGKDIGGFVRRKCSSDRWESWAAQSQTHISHTLTDTRSPMRDLCECVFRRGGDKRECEVAKPQFHIILFRASKDLQSLRLVNSIVILGCTISLGRAVLHLDI